MSRNDAGKSEWAIPLEQNPTWHKLAKVFAGSLANTSYIHAPRSGTSEHHRYPERVALHVELCPAERFARAAFIVNEGAGRVKVQNGEIPTTVLAHLFRMMGEEIERVDEGR